jgi:hypothetical protein
VKTGLQELIERRDTLVARSAAQREELARAVAGVRRGLLPGQLALDAWRLVKARPLLAGLAVGLLVVVRPRRLLTWVSTGLTLYSLAQRLAVALRAPVGGGRRPGPPL